MPRDSAETADAKEPAPLVPPGLPERPGPKLPRNWQAKFLDYLEAHGTYHRAARFAGVSQDTVTRERHRNPAFEARCADARELHADQCEEELQASANRSDNPVGWIVRLKAIRPQQYIEKHAVLSVNVSAELNSTDVAQLLTRMLANATPDTAQLFTDATPPALPAHDTP